jgi:hypothetical protein
MKTFLEYLSEEEEENKPLRLRLLPAIRHPSGKIHTGKRGEDHREIREKYTDEEGPLKGEAGFYDTRKREFLSREEAAKHAARQGASGESTEFLTAAERAERAERLRGVDTTDTMSDLQRMRKFGTFEEETIQEGNPLSRIQRSPRHSIIMSAERKDLSPEENKSRMTALKKAWRERGYGFRKTEGKWDEGGGVGKENSIYVFAKDSDAKSGAKLRKHARRLSKQFDQDAFIHRKPDAEGRGTAIYTGTERKGQKDDYGPSRYNVDNPYGETTFKTRKPEAVRPKLTFKPRED